MSDSDVIAITPAMIDAGEWAYADYQFGIDDDWGVVRKIYLAMEQARIREIAAQLPEPRRR